MSQVEVLTARAAVSFGRSSADKHAFFGREEDASESLVHSPPSTSPLYPSFPDHHDEEVRFDNLPPLLRGHPDIHLRNGVIRANRLAAVHEPDAEKAFFVADLSYVYMQHARWKRALPEIEPFYGKLSFVLESTLRTH